MFSFLNDALTFINRIRESVWLRQNWPLLIPILATPVGYLFVQNYFAYETPGPQPGVPLTTPLSFKQVVLHWAFQIICGAALVLTGVLWWVVFRRRLRPSRRLPAVPGWLSAFTFVVRWFYGVFPRKSWCRLGGSIPIVVLGISLVVAGVWRRNDNRIVPPPRDKLVVAVCEFTGTAVKGAPNVASLLKSALQKRDAVAPVLVKGVYKDPIDDPDPDVKRANAVLLGKYKSAHIVVWGEVLELTGGGGLSATFDFAVANDWYLANDGGKNDSAEGEFEAARKAYDPGLAPQKARGSEDQIANRIGDVAALLLGLSYYRLGETKEAEAIFNTVKSGEGRLWRGFCYRESGQIDLAITEYKKVLVTQSDTDLDDDERQQLRGRASLLLGDAYADIGDFQTARTNYEAARDAFQIRAWKLQNNLGVALFALASTAPRAQTTELLGLAKKAYEEGVPLLEVEEASADEHARVLLNLGVAVAKLATASTPAEKSALRREAKALFESAQRYISPDPSVVTWARIQHNLANTLADEGNETEGQAGFDLLQKAVERYDSILKVCRPENDDRQFALTQAALGETHFDLSKRTENAAPELSLLAARFAYKQAIEAWDRGMLPIKAAASRRFLAEALLALANRVNGAKKVAYICEAIDNLDKAARTYGASGNTQEKATMTRAMLSQANAILHQTGGHC